MSPPPPAPTFDLDHGLASQVRLNNGVRMPVLGLGVWKTPKGVDTVNAVASALRAGYRLIDTATLYDNEADVGAAVHASATDRSSLFVTTKLWNADQGFEAARRAFEGSRSALRDEVVDLYLVHWPVTGRRKESWRALVDLQREGRVRAIGVSNFTVRHLEELLGESEVVPAVNQVEFSPFLFQRDLLEFCRGHRIQLEAYAPLTRGHRLDHPVLRRIAEGHRRTPAQVVLRWALQHEVVVIPKTIHPERMRENAGALEFALGRGEMEEIDALDEGYRTTTDPSTFA